MWVEGGVDQLVVPDEPLEMAGRAFEMMLPVVLIVNLQSGSFFQMAEPSPAGCWDLTPRCLTLKR